MVRTQQISALKPLISTKSCRDEFAADEHEASSRNVHLCRYCSNSKSKSVCGQKRFPIFEHFCALRSLTISSRRFGIPGDTVALKKSWGSN